MGTLLEMTKAVDATPLDSTSADAFSVSLRQLQELHQHQVFALVREVTQLRSELGRSSGTLSPTNTFVKDVAPGWCTGEVCVLKAHKGSLAGPEAPAVPAAPEAPETLDLPEPEPLRHLPQAKQEGRWKRRASIPSPKTLDVPEPWHHHLAGRYVPGTSDVSPERSPRSGQVLPVAMGALDDHPMLEEAFQRSERSAASKSQVSYPSSSAKSRTPGLSLARSHSEVERRSQLFRQYDDFRAKNTSASRFTTFWIRVVSSPVFDFSIGCVIALNAVLIGVESSFVRSGSEVPFFLRTLDYIFLGIYSGELCVRFGALGSSALWSPGIQFDILLLLCGVVDISMQLVGDELASHYAGHVDVVRTLRLARLARMVRLMGKSSTLWFLVQGMLNSLATLVWTCIILLILIFIFSVLGLELLTPDPSASEEYNEVTADNFGSLLRAMTTLLMGLSLDNFGEIYRPIMIEKPLTALYFIPFFFIVPVALMNLVTALMVNSSMEQTSRDKAAEEQKLAEKRAEKVRILEQAFMELDTNRCGRIDLEEMMRAPKELQALIFDVADVKDSRKRDLAYIFKTLDFDKSGYLEIREFCEGLLKLNDPTALEAYATVRYCTNIATMLKDGGGGGVAHAVARVASSLTLSRSL